MMKKFLLSLSSFSPSLILYLITVDFFPTIIGIEFTLLKLILIFIASSSFSKILLYFYKKSENRDKIIIKSIEPIENQVIPTYIGLFVIMLGLGGFPTLVQLEIILLLFLVWSLFMERTFYFTLFWLVNYKLYKVTDEFGNSFSIYSKDQDIKISDKITKVGLLRINNFTFVDLGG